MRVLLLAAGTLGDVHPLVALGRALCDRGHDVVLISYANFEPVARRAGLGFIAWASAEDYQLLVARPPEKTLLDKARGLQESFRNRHARSFAGDQARLVRHVYQLIADRVVPGETIVAAPVFCFGARIAQERLGIPLVTVLLQPAFLRSCFDTPRWPGRWLPNGMPSWYKQFRFWLSDLSLWDRLAQPVQAFRRDLNLPTVRRLCDRWWWSPQRVLGLFPDWFASQQPDWPPAFCLTGFPLYDEGSAEREPAHLSTFLNTGTPPIVFTPGTGMQHGREFLETAVAACQALGRRGLLLTPFRDQVPARLPDSILHCDYAPLSRVLPRAAAILHHGGIGTAAQALAAGVPQLMIPRIFDQFDNAARLQNLGVAASVRSMHPANLGVIVPTLRRLLTTPEVAEACRIAAARIRAAKPLAAACEVFDDLLHQHRYPVHHCDRDTGLATETTGMGDPGAVK